MLSDIEKQALQELKSQGYSFTEAMSFVGGQRLGESSRVKEKLQTTQQTKQTKTSIFPTSLSETAGDVAGVFKNAGQTAYETGEGIVQKAKEGKPKGALAEFVGGIGKMVGGFYMDAPKIALSQDAEDKIKETAFSAGQKIGSTELAQKLAKSFDALPPDVKGQIGDAGKFAEGLLAVLGGKAVESGVRSGLSTTKSAAVGLGKVADDVVGDLAKIKVPGIEGIAVSKKLGINPESLMQRVARVSKSKQAAFEDTAGESVGKYLVRRGIFGAPDQIAEQLYTRMRTSMGRVDDGLKQIKGEFKDTSLQDALDSLIEREIAVSTARTPSKDLLRVTQLQNKLNKSGLTLTEANEVKRLFERNVKLDYLKDNVSGKVAQANNIDSGLREFVANTAAKNGFKDIAELNKETRLAKQLLDDLGAEYAGQQGNNLISLSDAFFLAEAASNPTALAAFGLKKTLSSKGAMSAVAKLLSKETNSYTMPTGVVDDTTVTASRLGMPTSGSVPVTGESGIGSVPIR